MSKYNIPPQFQCQNRILNVKILYSASVRISKYDRGNWVSNRPDNECQKAKTKNEYEKRIRKAKTISEK